MSASELPFKLGSLVGRGATARVFEADLPEGGGPWVAKVLTLRTPRARERFLREGKLLARLEPHPGVVPVHSVGQFPDGAFYMILPRVEGQTLRARLKSGSLTIEEVTSLLTSLAGTLAHLHRHGVTHRDIKPANILLDAQGAPRLVDFGIALVEGESRLTATGDLLGTPRYMAPEQVRPAMWPVGPATDVHAFGQLAYELLVGEPAFQGDHPPMLLAEILHTRPLGVRVRRPDVDPNVETLVARCLEKNPARRFPNGVALVDALRLLHSNASRGQPAREWPLTLAAALLGGMLCALLTAGLFWPAGPVPGGPSVPDRSDSSQPAASAHEQPPVNETRAARSAEETVRAYVAAYNRQDAAGVLETYHPNAEQDGLLESLETEFGRVRLEVVLEHARFLNEAGPYAFVRTVELTREILHVEGAAPYQATRDTQLWALRRHGERWLFWSSHLLSRDEL